MLRHSVKQRAHERDREVTHVTAADVALQKVTVTGSVHHGVPHAVLLDPEPRTGPVLESPGASEERAGETRAQIIFITVYRY